MTRVAAVALSLSLTAGCSIGERQRLADLVHGTRDLAAKQPAMAGSLTYDLQLHPRSLAETAGLLGVEPGPLVLTAEVVIEAGAGRSEVRFGPDGLPVIEGEAPPTAQVAEADPAATDAPATAPAEAAGEALATPVAALFDDATVFVKRQNARPRERRTWARLDYAALPDAEARPPSDDLAGVASLVAAATTVNPAHLLDLAAGTLAGSTKLIGPATLEDGTAVRRLGANVSIEKALAARDLDDEEVETRLQVLRLLGVQSDVVPATFWLLPDDSLRRLRIKLPQRVNRRRSDHLVVTLDLIGPAPTAVAADPAEDETVTYERYGRLLRAAVPPR